MSFVIDSSVVLNWLLPDESREELRPVFSCLDLSGAHSPILLRYEVNKVLLMAERRGRIDAAFRLEALADFEAMTITCDVPLRPASMVRVADLAATHGLTGYDAAYLALSLDFGLPLASIDRQLVRVAAALHVPLF